MVSAAAALTLVACGASDESRSNASPSAAAAGEPDHTMSSDETPEIQRDPVILETIDPSPRQDVASALRDPENPELPVATIDREDLLSGGPPPDGIPAIDAPAFEPVGSVAWLSPDEPVIALATESGARAYPVQILMWHEIVNDVVDSRPVSVTYCPLCNTALAFDRRVDDLVLDFGVSGLLFNSDLVMYDRQTESLWPQIEGEAVAGVLTGTVLERIPVQMISWQAFADQYPQGWVLSRQTGHDRDYGRNPYIGYDAPGSGPLFPTDGDDDDRLAAKQRVIGIESTTGPIALSWDQVRDAGVVNLDRDQGIVAWIIGDTTSPLDARDIGSGRAVGMSGVFSSLLDGQALTFSLSGDDVIDDQTGSRWSVTGLALDGPLAGAQLDAIPHVDTFWFAWVAFHPDVTVL